LSIHDEFISSVVNHPEWTDVRYELIGPDGISPNETFGELCWFVNNGPGYCQSAPEHIKEYLRRLDVKV